MHIIMTGPAPDNTPGGIVPTLMPEQDEAGLEAGRLLFAKECNFIWGAADEPNLPEATLPEIAFADRSNVGKSSLVNALTGRKTLARTSNTRAGPSRSTSSTWAAG